MQTADLPPTAGERRTEDPIIQAAIRNVEANIAAFTASEVVQLALFPSSIAEWAATTDWGVGQVTNMLRRHRPYVAIRQALAERFAIAPTVLSRLIDTRPAQPTSERVPPLQQRSRVATDAQPSDTDGLPDSDTVVVASVGRRRDGTNPLEQIALERMRREAPAMPPSRIVGYALYPESLASWSIRLGRFPLDYLLACLGNVHRSTQIEVALARRLNVSVASLDHFIRGRKREPTVLLPPPKADVPVTQGQ